MFSMKKFMCVSRKKLEDALYIKLCLIHVNKMLLKPLEYMKPKQVDCTYAAVDNDVLCILPTGYGKTLLFNTIPTYSKMIQGCKTKTVATIISPLSRIPIRIISLTLVQLY